MQNHLLDSLKHLQALKKICVFNLFTNLIINIPNRYNKINKFKYSKKNDVYKKGRSIGNIKIIREYKFYNVFPENLLLS